MSDIRDRQFGGSRTVGRDILTVAVTFCCSIWFCSGCGTSKIILSKDIAGLPGEKYIEIVRPAPLVGVVIAPEENVLYDTLNGQLYPRLTGYDSPEIVTFDSSGGTIDLDNRTVTGVSEAGKLFTGGFVNLLFLQVKEVDLAKKFITPMELTCDWESVTAKPGKRIKHGSSPCWDVVEFEDDGGRYDSTTQAVVGLTKRGTPVAVKTQDILQARNYRKNPYKTARLAISVAGLFLFANGTLHFWDGY